MEAELGLSVAAQQRRDDQLPMLLGAVRRRSERRRRRRAAVVALLVLFVVGIGRWFGSSSVAPAVPPSPSVRDVVVVPSAAGPVAGAAVAGTRAIVVAGSKTVLATLVRDDPAAVVRHVVVTQPRATWFVDDQGLQELLRTDGRADGLVRIDGRVLVRAAAIDPYDAP